LSFFFIEFAILEIAYRFTIILPWLYDLISLC
jgi:hypothetical protein